jgi:hypothetical protein
MLPRGEAAACFPPPDRPPRSIRLKSRLVSGLRSGLLRPGHGAFPGRSTQWLLPRPNSSTVAGAASALNRLPNSPRLGSHIPGARHLGLSNSMSEYRSGTTTEATRLCAFATETAVRTAAPSVCRTRRCVRIAPQSGRSPRNITSWEMPPSLAIEAVTSEWNQAKSLSRRHGRP